jgi:hypothetical protein
VVEGSPRASEQRDDAVRGGWWSLWSEPAGQDRAIIYMSSTHINSTREGWSNDYAFALLYRSLYGGTFRTTHGPRAWTFGLERSWAAVETGPVGAMLGFRTGLMYGYDEELGWLAGDVPVLPFFSRSS